MASLAIIHILLYNKCRNKILGYNIKMFKQLVQSVLTGGAPKAGKHKGMMLLSALVAIVVSLLVRAVLVNLGWNMVMPKLTKGAVVPLNYTDSLVLVILVSSLVNM
jgi:hypothetical protein